jgi:hypothetical protein
MASSELDIQLVLSNFNPPPGEKPQPQLKLMSTMFQGMFPPIQIDKVSRPIRSAKLSCIYLEADSSPPAFLHLCLPFSPAFSPPSPPSPPSAESSSSPTTPLPTSSPSGTTQFPSVPLASPAASVESSTRPPPPPRRSRSTWETTKTLPITS